MSNLSTNQLRPAVHISTHTVCFLARIMCCLLLDRFHSCLSFLRPSTDRGTPLEPFLDAMRPFLPPVQLLLSLSFLPFPFEVPIGRSAEMNGFSSAAPAALTVNHCRRIVRVPYRERERERDSGHCTTAMTVHGSTFYHWPRGSQRDAGRASAQS